MRYPDLREKWKGIDSENRRDGARFSIWGVPITYDDTWYFISCLKRLYLQRSAGDIDLAVRLVLRDTQPLETRSGFLAALSAFLIAAFFSLCDKSLITLWEQVLFYSVAAIWIAATMWLAYAFRDVMPAGSKLGEEDDLDLTLQLYVQRKRAYNFAVIVTLTSFPAMALLMVLFGLSHAAH